MAMAQADVYPSGGKPGEIRVLHRPPRGQEQGLGDQADDYPDGGVGRGWRVDQFGVTPATQVDGDRTVLRLARRLDVRRRLRQGQPEQMEGIAEGRQGVNRSPAKLTQPDTQSVDLGTIEIGTRVFEHQT